MRKQTNRSAAGPVCSRPRLALAFLAAALALPALFAAPALAGPPTHVPLPGETISGLNHACGTAVDPEGDVYVSSAGESKVKVFDPQHNELTSIPNANEPCGLAVDSRGTLYVAEQATGNVVRFVPNAFPLSATPTYGPAQPVDLSGEAEGISVDLADDRLYVAKGDHVMVYQNDGTTGQNEVQQLFIQSAVTSGTFTLSFEGETTAPLPYNASSSEVREALEALTAIGTGNLEVEEANLGVRSHYITFTHSLGSKDVAGLSVDPSGLVGGSASVQVSTEDGVLTNGFAFNGVIGEGELSDATAVAAYTYSPGQNTRRFLFVADSASETVKVLSGADIKNLKTTDEIDGQSVPDSVACPSCSDGFGFGAAGAALGVDQAKGHVLVYDDAHKVLDEFEASGQFLDQISHPDFADAEATAIAPYPEQDEIQHLRVSATGGSFTLSFEGQTTAPIAVKGSSSKPSGAEIEAALESLSTVGVGNASVFGSYNSAFQAGVYTVGFKEALGGRNVPALEADSSGLSGGGDASVTTEVGGSGPGRLYVSTGAGAGAKLLAFGPLVAPGRLPLGAPLSHVLANAKAVATDSKGNVYVGADAEIHVYGPDGKEVTKFEDPEGALDLAVDSTGKVYVVEQSSAGGGKLTYYTPSTYPPVSGTTYTRQEPPIADKNSGWPAGCSASNGGPSAVAVNPTDDHVFVTAGCATHELDSAAPGHESALLNSNIALGVNLAGGPEIAVDGDSGNIYLSGLPGGSGSVLVYDPTGTKLLARINGAGSLKGRFVGGPAIAVDQSNGHLLAFDNGRGVAEEYDASGAFVAEFGEFTFNVSRPYEIAIDNSGGPNDGNVYVAFDDPAPGTFDLTAFGPLAYGEPPEAITGTASGLGEGNATLNGTVDPRGEDLQDCRFEHLTDAQYVTNGKTFAGAAVAPCAESLPEIGKGSKPVAVHVDVSGLDPGGRYRFRLVAENKYGRGEGKASLFGPPVPSTKTALPVLYGEATLRGEVEPSGLPTEYRFEYGTSESYGQSTPSAAVAPGEKPVAVQSLLTGLAEGTTYHFRLLAENEAGVVQSPDQVLTTLARRPADSCPNTEFRSGLSANLPDCRAYELATPAETNGALIFVPSISTAADGFNNWLSPPRGPGSGGALTFASTATLPGFEGSGVQDSYRGERGAGAHPAVGWTTELVSPTYRQGRAAVGNGSSDQLYSFWGVAFYYLGFEDSLPLGTHLRTPTGFEVAGQGSLGEDLKAVGQFVSAGGTHVIFSSKAHLEEAAAPAGTQAIYDRGAGEASAEVVSVKPDGTPFDGGEAATYVGSSEDGAAIAFEVGGALYLHRGGETVEVAASPNAFAGIAADGKRVFYADTSASPPDLYACEVEAGSCAGPEQSHEPTQIALNAVFESVSADGSHVFFSSKEALSGPEENEAGQLAEAGEHNLYVWGGAGTRFIAVLDPADFKSFNQNPRIKMGDWTTDVTEGGVAGLGSSPVRSTPSGEVFVFQSHAQLGDYENEGFAEIYRYAPAAGAGEQLTCVSCDPSAAAPGADASLEGGGLTTPSVPTDVKTLIANVTDDGQRVFFQSRDRLLPEDANSVQDVYEWQSKAPASCTRPGGCLALISSGQGEQSNYLYGMSADGHDVFFTTQEKLVGQDIPDSPSIYDARVEGGIPDPPAKPTCRGDACQGNGSIPPNLASPASSTLKEGGNSGGEESKTRCAKGQRKVRRAGKTRCVKRHAKKRNQHRANTNRRAHR